jgi:hypothetical protein
MFLSSSMAALVSTTKLCQNERFKFDCRHILIGTSTTQFRIVIRGPMLRRPTFIMNVNLINVNLMNGESSCLR